jgi:hypothetical protein
MCARYSIIIAGLSLLGFASTVFSGGQVPPKNAERSTATFSGVFEIVDPGSVNSSLGPEIDATTMLVRRNDGAGMSFNTKQLLPDAPYTAWWVIFNKPRQCLVPCECGFPDVFDPVQAAAAETSVFWATGRMTDSNGQATFSAQIGLNDLPSGDDQVVFGPGLLSPRAEIHLVTRTHGPALGTDEELEAQLTKFNGGCNPDCFDVQVSVHRSLACKAAP